MQVEMGLHVGCEKVCNCEKGAFPQREVCFIIKLEIQIFHSDEHFYAQKP